MHSVAASRWVRRWKYEITRTITFVERMRNVGGDIIYTLRTVRVSPFDFYRDRRLLLHIFMVRGRLFLIVL